MKKKTIKKKYTYQCNLSGQTVQTTREAASPGDLMSIEAYYEIHPENDDRPHLIKLEAQARKAEREAMKQALLGGGPSAE
jgi:hypothetical protein